MKVGFCPKESVILKHVLFSLFLAMPSPMMPCSGMRKRNARQTDTLLNLSYSFLKNKPVKDANKTAGEQLHIVTLHSPQESHLMTKAC